MSGRGQKVEADESPRLGSSRYTDGQVALVPHVPKPNRAYFDVCWSMIVFVTRAW